MTGNSMQIYFLDMFLVLIVIIYLILASIFDMKTREVPDTLSYSLVIIALSLRLIFSIIAKDFSFFLLGILGFVVFFIVANIMYYSKQWGGGDAKLLMGIGAALPVYPQGLLESLNPSISNLPFMAILFLNLIIIGAVYALGYSIYLAIKHKREIKKEFSSIMSIRKIRTIRKIIIFTSLVALIYALIQSLQSVRVFISVIVFSLIFMFYLIVFLKASEKATLTKKVSINKLTPGDWITKKITKNNKVLYDPKKGFGLTKENINILKNSKISYVEIKEGIPFTPAFVLSIIPTLIYGNILFKLVGI